MNRKMVLVVLAGFIVFTVITLPPPIKGPGTADFRAYWSASYLLSQGENFSNSERIHQVERDLTGWTKDHTVVTWNPPWLLVLLMPYAQFEFEQAAWLWLLTNIILITVAAALLWQALRKGGQNKALALSIPLIAFAFSPTLVAVAMGQVNTLVLLGLAGFLYFHHRERPFYAGVLLSLVMVKPHLVYLTLPLIFLQALSERRWRLFAGFCISLLALTLVAWLLRPTFPSEYFGHVGGSRLLYWQTPTLGGMVQTATGVISAKFVGIIVLPVTIYFFWTRYRSVSTLTLVSALTILSLITAPFGWSYDFIILLIPILHMLALAADNSLTRIDTAIIIIALLVVNIFSYYQRLVTENELYFSWMPLVVGMLYGWSLLRKGIRREVSFPLTRAAKDLSVQ